MRKFYLEPLHCTRVDDSSVIILGGRQFTIYDDYYVEQNINITETDPREDRMKTSDRGGPIRLFRGSLLIDGYLWFVQYDNHKGISLEDFRRFMSKFKSYKSAVSGGFNFNDAVNYIGVSCSDIPQIGF